MGVTDVGLGTTHVGWPPPVGDAGGGLRDLTEGAAADGVDTSAHRREGFVLRHTAETGVLSDSLGGPTIRWANGRTPVLDLGADAPLALDAVRPLAAVEVRWHPVRDPLQYATVVASLAAAGVPLVCGAVPRWARHLLGRRLSALIDRAPGPWATLEREAHSIRLRREVQHGQTTGRSVEVAVVLASRRPDMLAHAIQQLAGQVGVTAQLVLSLHGVNRLPNEAAIALADSGLAADVATFDASTVFGDVLNASVERADTDIVTKWDDDDHYGPHHLQELVSALSDTGADVVGSNAEFVHLEQLDVTVLRQSTNECWATHVAGGTITTRRSVVHDVGGFPSVPRHVDKGLLEAVTNGGGRIYRAHGHNMVLRRSPQGHTWDPGVDYFLEPAYPQSWGLAGGPAMTDDDAPRHWL